MKDLDIFKMWNYTFLITRIFFKIQYHEYQFKYSWWSFEIIIVILLFILEYAKNDSSESKLSRDIEFL